MRLPSRNRVPLARQRALVAPVQTLRALIPKEQEAAQWRIISPMIPAFRAIGGDVKDIQQALRTGDIKALVRDVLETADPKIAIRLSNKMRAIFPRIKALVEYERAAVMNISDIESLLEYIPVTGLTRFEMMVRASSIGIATEFAKHTERYFAGGLFPATAVPSRLSRVRRVVEQAFAGLQQGDFRFVIDFTTAGSVNDFLASFFASFAGKPAATELKQIIAKEIAAGRIPRRIEVSAKRGIVEKTKGGYRSAVGWVPPAMLQSILDKYLTPALERAWQQAVRDFFLRKPTSVSRWFPMRPMARKGLSDEVKSLMGMLLSGKPTLIGVTKRTKGGGFYGVFKGFEVSRAPYWTSVEYGQPGVIKPRKGKYLKLQDPPYWQHIVWTLGQEPSGIKLDTRIGETRLLPDMPKWRVVESRPKGYKGMMTYLRTNKPVTWRTMMPSGYRFSAQPFLRRSQIRPVVHKGVAVTFRVERGVPRLVKRVRGQRPSFFLERIIASFNEYNDFMQPALLEAASVFLVYGTRAWERVRTLLTRGPMHV